MAGGGWPGGGTKMKKIVIKGDLLIAASRSERASERESSNQSNHEIESNDPIRCEADSTI